MSPTITHKT